MKKIILFIPVAGLFLFSSCVKDRVCKCYDQDNNWKYFVQKNQKLEQAKAECRGREFDQTVLGIHTSNTCVLEP